MRRFSARHAFVLQRVSALALLAFLAAAALRLAFGAPVTVAQWQAWIAQPPGAILLLLLVAALLAHAWVGIRDVALDYVKPFALRLAVLGVAAAGLSLLAAWTVLILASHAL